jgi:RNA recognition motif-containing protein
MNIYVGNISFKVNDDQLRQIFEEYGEVKSAKIITDNLSGRSKGFGFVEMTNDTEAQEAINELQGAELFERELVVNQARPKTEGGERGSRPPRREYSGNNNRRSY